MPEHLPVEHQKISSLVENYYLTIRDVELGLHHLVKAKERIGGTIRWSQEIYIKTDFWEVPDDVESCKKEITASFWRYALSLLNFNAFMTDKRKREIEHQIESGELPPFTTENVMGTLQGFVDNLDDLLKESIGETFDFLRQKPRWGKTYKTNKEFRINKKVILDYIVDVTRYSSSYRSISLSPFCTTKLQAMDNTFSLLDGKGIAKYPGNLVTALRLAMSDKKTSCETEYFKCKWFFNRNMHIEFKRLDLLKEVNKIGGSLTPNAVGKSES